LQSSNGDRPQEGTARPGSTLLVAMVRRAGGWLAPLVALTALGAGATVAFPAVLGRAVDEVVAATRAGESEWVAARGALLATAALLGVIVIVDALNELVSGSGTAGSLGRLRRDVVQHVLAVGPRLLHGIPAGDLVARLVGSTATTAQVVLTGAGIAAALVPPVGGVVALAIIDPWLAVTFAVGMLTVSRAVRTYLRDARVATTGYQQAQGDIAARLVDALGGARTIAAARTTDQEVERVLQPVPRLRHHGAEVWRTMARLAFRGEPVVLLTQIAVVAVAGIGLGTGRLSPGEMLAASRYAVMAAGIGGILDELAALTRARAGAERVAAVLDQPATSYGTGALPPGPGQLELRGVTAGPTGAPVVVGLDLVVPSGQTVALVGRSGAGKSLTAAVAGRLSDPQAGQVLLDGTPLDQLDRPTLRAAVTYAFERPWLLGTTIADAIGFGVDRPSRPRLEQAAAAARADGFIARLPDGYEAALTDTPLSGGELQRLGLARALARDARVLILDDATSSLDTATEAEITAALTARHHGGTRLIVTHRQATAARADLVAWLDGGRVRAVGRHDELWADPDYRAAFGAEVGADVEAVDR
jgi:ATP-binding cassette, subfamily B, bacterial